MAEATTYWNGLTRKGNILLQVNTDSATFSAYIGIIAEAEGLSSSYYCLSLQRDPRFNSIDYPTEFFVDIETDLGIPRLVNGDVFIATPLQDGLTKEQKQVQKLNIAAATREADGNARFVYDITQLPNPYNDNEVDPDENPNTGGLVQGRPWVELAAGLYRRTYSGYFNDAVVWFASATQTAASADSTLAIANTPETTSVQWLGYFIPATTETYTFYINSDDASYLWIGSTAVSGFTVVNALINNGNEHGAVEVSGNVALTAGVRYAIRIQTGNNGGPGSHATRFSTPTIAKTSVFTGRIFYNPITNGF